MLLALVFIAELAVGIAGCVFKSDLEMMVRDSLQNTMKRSNGEDLMAWNHIQRKLMCCGVEYPSDWRTISRDKSLPPSCCRPQYIDENVGHCTESLALGRDKYYQVTSYYRLRGNYLLYYSVPIRILSLSIGGLSREAQGSH